MLTMNGADTPQSDNQDPALAVLGDALDRIGAQSSCEAGMSVTDGPTDD